MIKVMDLTVNVSFYVHFLVWVPKNIVDIYFE